MSVALGQVGEQVGSRVGVQVGLTTTVIRNCLPLGRVTIVMTSVSGWGSASAIGRLRAAESPAK